VAVRLVTEIVVEEQAGEPSWAAVAEKKVTVLQVLPKYLK
jgi:hypothetical protein